MSAEQSLEQYLASLKEGDVVYRDAGANSLDRVRVARVTATQIVLITGGRYNRTTGRSIGTSAGWDRSNIRLPSPAVRAEWQRKYLANWAANPLPKIFRALPPAQQALLYTQIKDMEKGSKALDLAPEPATKPTDDPAAGDSDDEARKNRIEVCLSACDGYTNEQLLSLAGGNVKREVTHFADQLCHAQGRYLKAEQHRDSLLSALKALLEHEGAEVETGIGMFPSDELEQARKQAQAVIEEVGKACDY